MYWIEEEDGRVCMCMRTNRRQSEGRIRRGERSTGISCEVIGTKEGER